MTLSVLANGSSHARWMALGSSSSTSTSTSNLVISLQRSIIRPRLRSAAAICPIGAVKVARGFKSGIQGPSAARRTPPFLSGAGSPTLASASIISATPRANVAPTSTNLHSRLEPSRYFSGRHALLCNTYLAPSRAFFSTSARTMAATRIDGTAIAKKIRERLHEEIAEKQKINPRYNPSLKIIQGASRSSVSFIVGKKKFC